MKFKLKEKKRNDIDSSSLESKKSIRKSLKERKKFQYGDEIIKFLEKYGYNKHDEDFEQNKDYSTVTYMYAIPHGMRPQTPYVEFTVDADNGAFIFGEYFTDGRKGYSTEFDSVEDLKYFVSNANYSNVDLTESKCKIMTERTPSYYDDEYYGDDLKNFKKSKLNLLDGLKISFASLMVVNSKSHAIIYDGVIEFSGYMYVNGGNGSNIQFDINQVKSVWIDWANKQLNLHGKDTILQISFYEMNENEFEQLIVDLEN